jgi:Zn ribbon nucleic-acid-binding protein
MTDAGRRDDYHIVDLNNYLLECVACGADIFVYSPESEVPGYSDTVTGMRCPQCDSQDVWLGDCDERRPRHRAAKDRYRSQHPERGV